MSKLSFHSITSNRKEGEGEERSHLLSSVIIKVYTHIGMSCTYECLAMAGYNSQYPVSISGSTVAFNHFWEYFLQMMTKYLEHLSSVTVAQKDLIP